MTAIGSLPRHRGRGRPAVEEPACSFARGMNYYKLFWVFFLCSFLGAVVETIFMFLTRGEIQDRSSVIYGPFSLVWGMGAVLFTLCFHRLAGRRDLLIFIGGTVLGGTYEYLCSWGQEVLFGARFWNYSHIPFNINGRVCLLYAMFWGVAAVVWIKDLYPRLCALIGRIPRRAGVPLTWMLTLFMLFDILISAAALSRWEARQLGAPPANAVEEALDRPFPAARLYRDFSTLTFVGEGGRAGP